MSAGTHSPDDPDGSASQSPDQYPVQSPDQSPPPAPPTPPPPPGGSYPPPGGSYPPPAYPPPAPGYVGAPPYPGYDPYAKSRLVAGLLGIFLGGIGVHRFYLGYTGIGVTQIIVTILTCGIGSIWGLIEGIMILANSGITTDAQGRPLRE